MAQLTSNDGTLLGYDEAGSGTPLILIDGAMAYRGYRGGRLLAAALSNHFTVVTYDRRGRGESTDTPPYSVDREIEDIAAILQHLERPAHLYGFSSGAVLALYAAARLGDRVLSLAMLEPPFSPDTPDARREFTSFGDQLLALLRAGARSEAVEFFLKDMLPPEVLQDMKQTRDWKLMEAVAHTMAYDVALLGDGCVPERIASTVSTPALVLDGGESDDYKHVAAEALARALPRGRRRMLEGQMTLVPPEILAPILIEFCR
jgi:pimeloyl-ACP methyl ester carboxylesterase